MNYAEFRKRYQWNAKTDKLGEGGFGKVYRAVDTARNRPVVLKIADVPIEHKFSLQREVELNRDLAPHPNIAQYRNCYRLEDDHGDERDYATMDYFPDGSLMNVMGRSMNSQDLHDIVTGMLHGLIHLERERVIHRDFKPSNVLMAREEGGRWIPKIADFGLSRFTDMDTTVSNSSIGISYDYAAPEQFQPGPVNRQADLWALGVIVYRLCMGKTPFSLPANLTGESRRLQLIYLINQAQLPTDIDQVEEPYQTIVCRCLVKNLSERVKSAEELLTILSNVKAKPEAVTIEPVYTETVLRTPSSLVVEPKEVVLNPAVAPIAPVATVSDPVVNTRSPQPTQRKSTYTILAVFIGLLLLIAIYHVWQQRSEAPAETPGQIATPTQPAEDAPSASTAENRPVLAHEDVSNSPQPTPVQNAGPVQPDAKKSRSGRPQTNNTDLNTEAVETVTQPEETQTPVDQKPEPVPGLTVPAEANAALSVKTERPETRSPATTRSIRLSGGTEIVITLAESVAAATVKEGQRLAMQVARPVTASGEVVIPQGADVVGEVSNVNTGGKKDLLEIRIRSVQGVGGQIVKVRSATFRYIGSRNESLEFKAGQQFIVYTDGAYRF